MVTPVMALYLYVFPVMALIATPILIILWFLLPSSAKTLLKARVKRSGAVVFLSHDNGYTRIELMNEKMGMGILSGNPTSYLFTPRPTYVEDDDGGGVDGKGAERKPDMTDNERSALNELILHRQFMDVGKPVYFGYVGKSIAITPRLLKAMKESGRAAAQGRLKPPWKAAEAEAPQVGNEEVAEVRRLELLDPRVIKIYMPWTFNQSLIDNLTLAHERMAELRKPLRTAAKIAIPITIIVVVVIIAYMFLQGGGLSSVVK